MDLTGKTILTFDVVGTLIDFEAGVALIRAEVEALTKQAQEEVDSEKREALINTAEAKVKEIEKRREALEKSLAEAESKLKVE